MPYLTMAIARITGYDGPDPTLDSAGAVSFDNLRMPLVKAERRVEAVEAPGLDYHGLRIGAVRPATITVDATVHTLTVAAGVAVRDALRAMKPAADTTYYGVLVTYAGVVSGPYDLLAADLAGPYRGVLAATGTVVANPNYLFRYAITLRERAPNGA